MTINIVSPSGGMWRSTLAAGLAVNLSAVHPGQVLLVDGCSDGGVQWLLGAERTTAYDLGDALCGRCCAGDAVFRCENFDIMPCAADDGDIHPRQLAGLLSELARKYRFVIFDSPCGSWSLMDTVAAVSELNLLCTAADDFHLDAAYRLRRRLPVEDERCRLVLTDYSVRGVKDGSLHGIDYAIDRVGARLIGVLPVGESRGGRLCDTGCANISRRISGADVPLMKLS